MGADVIIIGGGAIGRAIAYRLARDGMTVACVYPRGRFHGQASAAAGAMLGVFSEASAQDRSAHRHRDAAHRWDARQRYPALEALAGQTGMGGEEEAEQRQVPKHGGRAIEVHPYRAGGDPAARHHR